MAAFCDGSIIAQLGIPDMQEAIAYALSYPHRLALKQPLPDLAAIHALTFESPDFNKFPCLRIAFDAVRQGGTLPAVMNAANEVAVTAFLDGRIHFTDIAAIVEKTMSGHAVDSTPDLNAILDADHWSRLESHRKVEELATI
jgi:1-deoxy-D-xylulose-5-phosphate reductoisomerase